nr:aminotransferase class I/II-fold pyridoxal phosphate-dependent enzyme [Boudabousia tangfeifanii]
MIGAAEHGRYGYTEIFDDFLQAAVSWQTKCHEWTPMVSQAVFFPRIILAVGTIVAKLLPTQPKLVTLTPAYDPILEVFRENGAKIEFVPLANQGDRYEIDMGQLAITLADADVFLLTNPHNPTGKVFSSNELAELGKLIDSHPNLMVLSDDIHADFVWDEHRYEPLARYAPASWESGRLIQFTSPGKTFAMAGAEAAVAFTGSDELKIRLEHAKRQMGIHNPNYFAVPAAIAAWGEESDWLTQIKAAVRNNLDYSQERLNQIPGFKVLPTEGTFLQWVDGTEAGFNIEKQQQVMELTNVLFSMGFGFGNFANFFRLNAAIEPKIYREAIERLLIEIPRVISAK